MLGAVRFDDNGHQFHVNGNNNFDNNNGHSRGMVLAAKILFMKRQGNLYNYLCSYENLFLAYKKARRHKTTKDYVLDFEKNLKSNLLLLRTELLLHCYKPKPDVLISAAKRKAGS